MGLLELLKRVINTIGLIDVVCSSETTCCILIKPTACPDSATATRLHRFFAANRLLVLAHFFVGILDRDDLTAQVVVAVVAVTADEPVIVHHPLLPPRQLSISWLLLLILLIHLAV